MFNIRPATPDDIDAVLTFWEMATTEPSSTDDVASVAALLEFASGSLLLAVDCSVIVGTVIAGWDGWRGTLYRLAVAPERRREGTATKLVGEAERWLQQQGGVRVHLIVAAGEDRARRFWSSAGYTATDQTRFVKTFTPSESALRQ